jgi:hypothetical protein
MRKFKNTILLEDAINQTENWRKYYTTIYNNDPDNSKDLIDHHDNPAVFRGFFVSLKDLMGVKEILEGYLALNPAASPQDDNLGIRVYLAKEETHKSQQKNMHVLIVPVINNTDITNLALTVNGPPSLSDVTTESDTSSSTVFDFSAPCPDVCDVKSPLHGVA